MILGLVGPFTPDKLTTSPDISPRTRLDRQNLSPIYTLSAARTEIWVVQCPPPVLIGYLLSQDPGTHGAPSGSTFGDFPPSTFLQLQ